VIYRLLTRCEGDKVYKQTHTNHPSTIWCRESYSNFRKEITPLALAMPDKYKNKNPVKAYRDYFNGEKLHLAQWKNKNCPDWVIFA